MTHPKWLSTDLWEVVGEGMASAKQEVLLISPYVSSATIAAILADVDGAVGVTLITSLVPANFASGASDIEGL